MATLDATPSRTTTSTASVPTTTAVRVPWRRRGPRRWRALVVVLLAAVTGLGVSLPTRADDAGPWSSPLGRPVAPADVLRPFDPPPQPWDPGHRGVDLAHPVGAAVHATAPGTVTFAADVAGTPVVTVTHGTLRTTYQPVLPVARRGQQVRSGEVVGVLAADPSHCTGRSCLHWGLRRGEDYLDPLALLAPPPEPVGPTGVPRLLPLGARTLTGTGPPPPVPDGGPPPGAARLGWPLLSPRVTSPFGPRVHPVTGQHRVHTGTDFGAGCGVPVFASAAGTVAFAGSRGAYGLQIGIRHPGTSPGLLTSYAHLSSIGVAPGDPVRAGAQIGAVGTTGLSTGCHLHFGVQVGGRDTDPAAWLPGG